MNVGSVFREVCGDWIGKGEPVRTGVDVLTQDKINSITRDWARMLNLEVMPKRMAGRDGQTEDGKLLKRQVVYALCDLGDVGEATAAMVEFIGSTHGPGRVWWTSAPAYLRIVDSNLGEIPTRIQGTDNSGVDEPYVFTPTGDGTRRVLLGAYYFHEAAGTSQRAELKRPPTVKTPWMKVDAKGQLEPTNPLDVEYDGVPLRDLVERDALARTENICAQFARKKFTPAQRAAISAHWSAELRAKVAASKAADKEHDQRQVLVDLEDE